MTALRIDAFDPCILLLTIFIDNDEGCGACGQRGARWETRSVFHGKSLVRRRRIVHKSPAGVGFTGFGATARSTLGTPSPRESPERRTEFSLTTRTVAGAAEPAFLQGGV